ncbi:MAG TPA: hypothetical protein VF989_01715 [Polyangiaceae bacterium]
MTRCVLCAVACAWPLACSASFRAPQAAAPGAATSTHTEWMSFFLFGVIGGNDSDLRDLCGDAGAAKIRIGHDWFSALLTVGTLGLYAPRVVSVECAAP